MNVCRLQVVHVGCWYQRPYISWFKTSYVDCNTSRSNTTRYGMLHHRGRLTHEVRWTWIKRDTIAPWDVLLRRGMIPNYRQWLLQLKHFAKNIYQSELDDLHSCLSKQFRFFCSNNFQRCTSSCTLFDNTCLMYVKSGDLSDTISACDASKRLRLQIRCQWLLITRNRLRFWQMDCPSVSRVSIH